MDDLHFPEGSGLTLRQHEILIRVARGMTNRDIARELHLAESTVKAHLSAVYAKLGVANRTQAAVMTLGPRVPASSR
jgi:DNA-binding NarL/FixJ family response regulator